MQDLSSKKTSDIFEKSENPFRTNDFDTLISVMSFVYYGSDMWNIGDVHIKICYSVQNS